jgi:NADP-dependent 3-hydroxy acid dehydrogenase YdfG
LGLIARNEEALEVAAGEVRRAGGEALVLPLDVTDADAVERAAAAVEERWGPIDVWINNAMATVFAPVAQTTAEENRRVTEVTYLGYVHGTLAALRSMRPRDEGMIVQIGSAPSPCRCCQGCTPAWPASGRVARRRGSWSHRASWP